jgi:hypothetical protein
MTGGINDEESLAQGISARYIGPETGSFGNATMTNHGDTSEGTNESFDSAPPPAAGIGTETPSDIDEHHLEGATVPAASEPPIPGFPQTDEESIAQQIADGGDHFQHGKTLHDHKAGHEKH